MLARLRCRCPRIRDPPTHREQPTDLSSGRRNAVLGSRTTRPSTAALRAKPACAGAGSAPCCCGGLGPEATGRRTSANCSEDSRGPSRHRRPARELPGDQRRPGASSTTARGRCADRRQLQPTRRPDQRADRCNEALGAECQGVGSAVRRSRSPRLTVRRRPRARRLL